MRIVEEGEDSGEGVGFGVGVVAGRGGSSSKAMKFWSLFTRCGIALHDSSLRECKEGCFSGGGVGRGGSSLKAMMRDMKTRNREIAT